MPLDQNKLAKEMEKMDPTTIEIKAARRFATAFTSYFYDAVATGSVTPGSLNAAKAAMLGALAGMSAPGAGAAAFQAGISAFWGVVAGAAATIWPGTVGATPPPTLSAISAAVMGVAPVNTAGKLSKSQAMKAVAAVIHVNNLGGLATLPPPASPVPIA